MSKPVIDFDHRGTEYRDRWQSIARDLHERGSIGWTESHGGYWVVADYHSIHAIAEDYETFTSDNDVDGTGNGGRGQTIPRQPYRLFLGESDPPFHTQRRRIENPFFTPKALRRWAPVAHQFLNEAIDAVIERGSADLIDDIIVPTTARTTLYVLGYDPNDWKDAAMSAHQAIFLLRDDPNYPDAEQARLRKRFREMILERKENPRDDLITALAHGETASGKLSLDEAESMMNALVFGGFDTTTALTAHAVIWLDSHPQYKGRFRDDEPFRRNAIEELLRYFPPTPGIARTAVRDTEVLGQKITAGESIYLWLAGGNRDPKVFTTPDAIDLERTNARDNVSFSAGHHRCLGSPLAKLEINEMLLTIFDRMPDLKVDTNRTAIYPSIGSVNGFSAVPVAFTPGKPSTTPELKTARI